MSTDHTGDHRGFIHRSRAWYAAATPRPDALDEVTFGWYAPDGGTSGEMQMHWAGLGGRIVPRLLVYDDAWHALATFTDVITKLGEQDDANISPAHFCRILEECGFLDLTPTENPYAPRVSRLQDK